MPCYKAKCLYIYVFILHIYDNSNTFPVNDMINKCNLKLFSNLSY